MACVKDIEQNKLPHGLFITIEGIDGSGKSSVAKKLQEDFKAMGFTVILTREPGGTVFGQQVRKILHERDFALEPKAEFLLFAADRSQHFEELIKPSLKEGAIVISDRNAESSLAYQGYGRSVDIDKIKMINLWATDNIVPDIILYLQIDYQTANNRIKERNKKLTAFEQENKDFFEKVINGFETIFSKRKNVITLDATLPIDIVAKQALEKVCNYLKQISSHQHDDNSNHNGCC